MGIYFNAKFFYDINDPTKFIRLSESDMFPDDKDYSINFIDRSLKRISKEALISYFNNINENDITINSYLVIYSTSTYGNSSSGEYNRMSIN